jgi:hypothetical protein
MTGTSGDIIGSVATSGKAIRGTATTGFGVYASATTGTAIYGESTGTGGAGINGTAGNGIGGYFLNNATGFATLYVTNNGSGNLANFSNSAGTKFTINNAGNLGNGTYTYTLPSATGTLALTSALSGYLPLTGGTLTGALSGTSATFSGDLTVDTNTLYVDSTNNKVGIGTTSPQGVFESVGLVYLTRSSQSLLINPNYGGANTHIQLQAVGNMAIAFATNGDNERMRITSGGDISTNGGSGSAGVSTATPKNFRFNNDYSNGYTDASLKMYLYNSGATIQGFTSGPSFDLQYHSSGDNTNGRHVWYIGNTEVMKIQSSSGNVTIAGSLSKGSGSFRIEHPLPSLSETHQLVHSFIEGPQADLIYRGKLTLVNGKAQANIDEVSTMTEGTFEALCRDIQCFTTNESGWDLIKGKVIGNIIYIESQNEKSTDEISWMVIGERKDKHMMDTEWTDENGKVIVEPLKPIEQEPMEDLTEVVEPIAEVTPEPTDNNLE